MISTIFRPPGYENMADGDIFVFLRDLQEFEGIVNSPLGGQIFNYSDARQIYPIEIIYDSSQWGMLSLNERDVNQNKRYLIYIGRSQYEELKEIGAFGGRNLGDAKIDVMIEDYANSDKELSKTLRRVKNIWENRDLVLRKLNENSCKAPIG